MTATEALEITMSNRKDTSEIIQTIKYIASSGSRSATLKNINIKEPELSKSILESYGYTVDMDENFFTIKW